MSNFSKMNNFSKLNNSSNLKNFSHLDNITKDREALLISEVAALTGTVSGSITLNGQAASVSITIGGVNTTVSVNTTGAYTLNNVPIGTQNCLVTASPGDWSAHSDTVSVVENQTTTHNLSLIEV